MDKIVLITVSISFRLSFIDRFLLPEYGAKGKGRKERIRFLRIVMKGDWGWY